MNLQKVINTQRVHVWSIKIPQNTGYFSLVIYFVVFVSVIFKAFTCLPLQIAISHWKLTCEESGNRNMEAMKSSAAPFSVFTVTDCCLTGHLKSELKVRFKM